MKKIKRINYFDVLKVFSILCVIYLHYPWTSDSVGTNITMLISYTAVPLFLMVNGSLILNKELDIKAHYIKTVKYFLTLIVWKLLTIIIFCATKQIDINNYSFVQIILSVLGDYNLPGLPTEHLWYLYALIKIYMILPFVQIFLKKYKESEKLILSVLITVIFGFELLQMILIGAHKLLSIPRYDISILTETYKPITAGRSLIYFLLGYYLHNKFYNKKLSFNKKINLCITFLLGLVLLMIARYIQTGQFIYGDYVGIKNEYHKIGTLIMSVSLFIFSATTNFKDCKIINYISKNTLNIYLIHMMICKLVTKYIAPIIGIYGAKGNILKTLFVFVASFAITEVLKRIKPIKKVLNLS